MELKIEHLAAYLPYGLKIKPNQQEPEILRSIPFLFGEHHLECGDNMAYELRHVNPLLIPLDKLTDEQYGEVGEIITGDGQPNILCGKHFAKKDGYSYDLDLSDAIALTDYLYSIKADIHGLITAGLAIDATALETHPYN